MTPLSPVPLRSGLVPLLVATAIVGLSSPGRAGEPDSRHEYLEFIRAQARALRAADRPPSTRDEWAARRNALRERLWEAWGGFPGSPCPLEARGLGSLDRPGYRVEKLVFQTRPGVWMTANAYVPEGAGKHPATLMVHGHWHGAKQDPVVQARCIGAAKLGYFVLVVDAFGSGERGVGRALGEYHGEMTAATLLPVGLPLSGLQVYENTRAVDYLRTRPEVDGARIGVTGASGGGNQTMYTGAWDERLGAVVPVCSVGNYQSYLGAACCLCEVVPGALRFAEEWDVLGLVAPRGLMVVNASRDAVQFSGPEAKRSLARVEPVYRLLGKPGSVRHMVFESGHDYSRPMREAMYGWMSLHLSGRGDGAPIAEPEIKTEDPESLRCYPGETRPDDWMTIPRFAAAEGRRLLAARLLPGDRAGQINELEARRKALIERVFGGFPDVPPVAPRVETASDGRVRLVHFQPDPGLNLTARLEPGSDKGAPLAVVIDLDGRAKAEVSALAGEMRKAGWGLVTLDLRATGALALPGDEVGGAPDHNSAEWALWIGRPLLGQWVLDVRRLLDALEKVKGALPGRVVLVGNGPGGLVALGAGAIDSRVKGVAAVSTLVSYVSSAPYVGQRLGTIAPGILRAVGDVAHLAALNAPRRVVIAGGVAGDGKPLAPDRLRDAYRDATRAWAMSNAPDGLSFVAPTDHAGILRGLDSAGK